MGRPKKKQEEIVVENIEAVTEDVVQPAEAAVKPAVENTDKATDKEEASKTTSKKKVVKEKQPEVKVTKKELTGTWKVELNPMTFAVKYKCSSCGRYTIPNGRPASKIDKCIFCGSKNKLKK